MIVRFPVPPTEPVWGRGQARYALFEDVDGNRFSLIEIDNATRAVEAERREKAAKLEAELQAAHELAIAKVNHASSRSGIRPFGPSPMAAFAVPPAPSAAIIKIFWISAREDSA